MDGENEAQVSNGKNCWLLTVKERLKQDFF